MSPSLASGGASVRDPLIGYAVEIGWSYVPPEQAMSLMRGMNLVEKQWLRNIGGLWGVAGEFGKRHFVAGGLIVNLLSIFFEMFGEILFGNGGLNLLSPLLHKRTLSRSRIESRGLENCV